MDKREKMSDDLKKAETRLRDLEEKWGYFVKKQPYYVFEPKHRKAFFSAHKGVEDIKGATVKASVGANLLGEVVNVTFTVEKPEPENVSGRFTLRGKSFIHQSKWLAEQEKKSLGDFKNCMKSLNYLQNMSIQDMAELFLQDLDNQENVLIQDIENTFEECLEIVKRKNKDYGEIEEDPYKNFRNSESVGVSPEKAILVRISDKLSRISTLLSQDAEVKQESIEDTINDAINYFAILKSFLKNN